MIASFSHICNLAAICNSKYFLMGLYNPSGFVMSFSFDVPQPAKAKILAPIISIRINFLLFIILTPVTSSNDGKAKIAEEAADGYEDEAEKINIKYGDNCIFQRAVMSNFCFCFFPNCRF